VDVISLPEVLPGELDLAEINRRLRSGEIALDWHNVREAAQEQLSLLLADLDLVEHSDALGLETIPDRLVDTIMQVFSEQLSQPSRQRRRMASRGSLETGSEKTEAEANPLPGNALIEDIAQASKIAQQPEVAASSLLLQPLSQAQLRDELEQLVLQDLLGPAAGPEEELEEASVRDRYLVGALAPRDMQLTPEEVDELAASAETGNEDGKDDDVALNTITFYPSSIGLSFCIDGSASSLLVKASWGCYQRSHSATLKKSNGAPALVWKRQHMGDERLFPLVPGAIETWSPEPEEQPDVVVRGLVRRSEHSWTITLFLVNEQREPEKRRDQAWVFQPELVVRSPDGEPIFQHRAAIKRRRQSDEEQAMSMLYRNQVGFAMGHGISVHAEIMQGDPSRAIQLSTRVVPTYDVPRTEAPTVAEIPGLAELVLDMKELAESDATALPSKLMPLVATYSQWITQQDKRIDDPSAGLQEYQSIARQSLQECQRAAQRIREGIQLLSTNKQAASAFAFMNRAMWQQRIHTLYAEDKRRGLATTLEDRDRPENRSWRPFQLAFILLNLPSLSDVHHPGRSVEPSAMADLLWFPTGGGKTEAYLGLTAYTLAMRRLQGTIGGRSGEDGVAVIMRYTLRLLTLQQFQRASALICACEVIRREDGQGTWGSTPFRLGLWVGQRTTPNTTEQSEEASKQERGVYRRGSTVGGVGSPRQLTNCPWCGSPIDLGRDIKIESVGKGRGRTLTFCSDPLGRCPFSRRNSEDGLPVLVVDEEIYRCLPSLLIATVDKFAQLPWNGATQMLFGKVDKKCSRHGFRSPDLTDDADFHRAVGHFTQARSIPQRPLRPPDLIIQDELHLISGPLGSLVALYESVVDRLSTWEVDGQLVRPKVIAATATIRRADKQVHALFMRKVSVFPPQGIDIADNFFARQREPNEAKPGRRYLGICASGRRLKAALIRVYVAYLSAGQYLYNQYGQAVDPWMTLVGYFNSMNELGGMRRLVEDDVRSRLGRMEQRGMARRNAPYLEELTSRKSSTDIPDILDRLERIYAPTPAKESTAPRPIDVLLATNMISVGVDVKRLGLMVVTGQPKTTAEYIQATSRVGRNAPGLVCVVFNWARPRDISHYEQFEHYHATFYQQVEALSVTPFAPRALDRGLAALLVSYVRLLGPEFNENSQAGKVDGDHPYFLAALTELAGRAETITGSRQVGESVREALEELRTFWLKAASAQAGTILGYKTKKDGQTIGLLHPPGQGDWLPFTSLNSLRDVEPSINLILDERGWGDDDSVATHVGNAAQVASGERGRTE
jgi:Helicase conserved C-terminal domain